MKQRISVTIDRENLQLINRVLLEGKFRNKSHLIDYSLNKFLKEEGVK
jgi:Arc/MetJ-type ribon-helix-helix transcriptional regulator